MDLYWKTKFWGQLATNWAENAVGPLMTAAKLNGAVGGESENRETDSYKMQRILLTESPGRSDQITHNHLDQPVTPQFLNSSRNPTPSRALT